MASRELMEFVRDAAFWRTVCPSLSIDGIPGMASAPVTRARGLTADELDVVRTQLHGEGYFRIPALADPDAVTRLEAGLSTLTRHGWPAVFVFLYDEPWNVFGTFGTLLSALLGRDYRQLSAFWAWNLEASDGGKGWGPHRDRTHRTVSADGTPEVITLWTAITTATPENGCIYLLPASKDLDYRGDLERQRPANLQDIRALPASAGGVLGWTHQLLHWGGHALPDAAPRMSLSTEFQRGDVEPLDALLERDRNPTWTERLTLISSQVVRYKHMQPPSAELLELAESIAGVAERSDQLDAMRGQESNRLEADR